jgi:hypothetical protein
MRRLTDDQAGCRAPVGSTSGADVASALITRTLLTDRTGWALLSFAVAARGEQDRSCA